jgi:hypothetical protein
MLNDKCEFMLGDSIFKIDDNWKIYCIKEADFDELENLRFALNRTKENDAEDFDRSSLSLNNVYLAQHYGRDLTADMPRVKEISNLILKSEPSNTKSNFSDIREWSYDNGKKKMTGKVTITNVFTGQHYVKATTRHYKRKRTLGITYWSKFKIRQYARVYGRVWSMDNDTWYSFPVSQSKWEDDKKAKAKYTFSNKIVIQDKELHGRHQSDAMSAHTWSLHW